MTLNRILSKKKTILFNNFRIIILLLKLNFFIKIFFRLLIFNFKINNFKLIIKYIRNVRCFNDLFSNALQLKFFNH